MKLTAALIFDRLAAYYDIKFAVSNNKGTVVGRPVFFEEGLDAADRVCIVTAPEQLTEALGSGVCIAVGLQPPAAAAAAETELMILPGTVPLGELFNRLQAIFDFYDAWESEMAEIAESEGAYQALLECATKYLDCPVSIVDSDFTIIGFSDNRGGIFRDDDNLNKVSPIVIGELLSDPQYTKGLANNDVFEFSAGGEVFLSYNFKRDGRYLGRVTLYDTTALSRDACGYLFRVLAMKIESVLRRYGSFLLHKESLSSVRAILLESLENLPVERQFAEYKLAELGWSYSDEYLLIRLQPEFRHEWQMHAAYLIPYIEQLWPGACAVEKGDYIVILVNQTQYHSKSAKVLTQELAYFLRDGLLLAGLSRPFRGLDSIPACYRQAELSVSLGREKNPMHWYHRFDDIALDCWIRYGTMSFAPEQLCSRVLLELLAYDRVNNTEYYKTLQTFFDRRFSFTHTAEALYIHRTTLIKRIERIEELTNVNLDDRAERLYIELSFHYLDETMGV